MMANHSHTPRRRLTRVKEQAEAQARAEAALTANGKIVADEDSDWWGDVPPVSSVCHDLAHLTVQTLVYTPFQVVSGMLPLRRTQQVIKHTVTSATDVVTASAQDVKSSEMWQTYTAGPSTVAKSTAKNSKHSRSTQVAKKKQSLTNGAAFDESKSIGSVRVRVLGACGVHPSRETSIHVGMSTSTSKSQTPAGVGPSVAFKSDEGTFDFFVTDVQSDVYLQVYQANRLSKDSCVGYVTIPVLHLASGRRHGLRGRFDVFPSSDSARMRYVPVLRPGMGEAPRGFPGYGYLNLEIQLQLKEDFRKSNIPVLPLLHAYMQDPSPGQAPSDAAVGSGSDKLLLNLQRCQNVGMRVFAPTGALLGAFFAAREWSDPFVTLCVHVLVTYWCLYSSTWQIPMLLFLYTLLSGYTQSARRASPALTRSGVSGETLAPGLREYTPWRNLEREQHESAERRKERRRAIASTVTSTVNMTMKLQGKTLVGGMLMDILID
jgi:hypothetical protein